MDAATILLRMPHNVQRPKVFGTSQRYRPQGLVRHKIHFDKSFIWHVACAELSVCVGGRFIRLRICCHQDLVVSSSARQLSCRSACSRLFRYDCYCRPGPFEILLLFTFSVTALPYHLRVLPDVCFNVAY